MRNFIHLCLAVLLCYITPAQAAWDDHKETIVDVAYATKVDVTLIAKVAFLESSYRSNSKASKGTSKGLMGITGPTWRHLVKTYGETYNVRNTDRLDPRAELTMGAMYLDEIRIYMEKRLGRDITHLENYLGYVFSPQRAVRLLNKNRATTLVAFYPDAAHRNQAIYFKEGTPRTIASVFKLFKTRMDVAEDRYVREASYLLSLKHQADFKPYQEAYANTDCIKVYEPSAVDLYLTDQTYTTPIIVAMSFTIHTSGRKHNHFYV